MTINQLKNADVFILPGKPEERYVYIGKRPTKGYAYSTATGPNIYTKEKIKVEKVG